MIIDISEWFAKPEAERKRGRAVTSAPPRCPHRRIEVDEKQRTVKCPQCDEPLDPIWCLMDLYHYRSVRKEGEGGARTKEEAPSSAERDTHRDEDPGAGEGSI